MMAKPAPWGYHHMRSGHVRSRGSLNPPLSQGDDVIQSYRSTPREIRSCSILIRFFKRHENLVKNRPHDCCSLPSWIGVSSGME